MPFFSTLHSRRQLQDNGSLPFDRANEPVGRKARTRAQLVALVLGIPASQKDAGCPSAVEGEGVGRTTLPANVAVWGARRLEKLVATSEQMIGR